MPTAEREYDRPDVQARLRVLAEEATRAGGLVARDFYGTDFDVRLKADHSEVSAADESAQEAAVRTIRAKRPDDAIIGEETIDGTSPPPPPPANDRLTWVIDPIDGTRNFVRHIPLYTCTVAAMFDGMPIVGATYDPVRDTMYAASQAEGLVVNGRLRPVPDANQPPPAGLNPRPVVALPSTPSGATADLAHEWLRRHVCRSLGSTALHIALVAAGGLEGMLADNAKLWDIAAGWVLVTAAGGKMAAPDGTPIFPLDVATYTNQELPVVAASATAVDRLMPS